MFRQKLLSKPKVNKIFRPVTSFSTSITLDKTHLETYWRGNLVKFDYDLLRENQASTDVYIQSQMHIDQTSRVCEIGNNDIDMCNEEENAVCGLKTHSSALPIFAIRRNDTIDIDWDDGTVSTLNLNDLLDQTGQKTFKNEDNIILKDQVQHEQIYKIFSEILSKHFAVGKLENFDNELTKMAHKLAMTREPATYRFRINSVKEAMMCKNYNGLILLKANKNIKIRLANGKILVEKFRADYPEEFNYLSRLPAIPYDCYPSRGWQKVISLRNNDDGKDEISQIRFGEIDNLVVCPKFNKFYEKFVTLINDNLSGFKFEMDGTCIFDKGQTHCKSLDYDENCLETISLNKNDYLVVDTTFMWYVDELDTMMDDSKLNIEQVKMLPDNWKSTARCMGLAV